MSLPGFTGTITQNLWQNESISPISNLGRPNSVTGYPLTSGRSRTFNPFNQTIKWNSNVPPSLQNLSINQIAQLGLNYTFNLSYVITVKDGNQNFLCSSITRLNMTVYRPDNNLTLNHNFESVNPPPGGLRSGTQRYCSDTDCPTFNFGEQVTEDNFPTPESYSIQVIPWNSTCENNSVNSLTFEIVTNINLIVACSTPEELNSTFCFDYCSQPNNQTSCYPAYRDYCLVDKDTVGDINIFTNRNCQEFFQDYFANQGPNSETDNDLENACSRKFSTVDEYNQGTSVEQNICACHLPQEIYDNLRNSLIAQYPGFQYVPENERCLFPPCPSSDYKTVSIGKKCALPACINIASVTNDGNLKGGVNINQNNACINAQNGNFNNGGGEVEEIKTWIDKYWVWLVIGIAILVILIIIILVVLSGEGNKKKKETIPKYEDI